MLAEGETAHVLRRLWGTALDGTQRLMVVRYDEADREMIERFTWYLREHPGGDWYANTSGKGYTTMHRLLMDAPDPGRAARLGRASLRIGHLNGDGLDNRRANLRWMTQSEILAKRRPVGGASRYKGVAWDRSKNRWVAVFRGKKLGSFEVEELAARAFDDASYAHWGRLGYLNFPDRYS